jgi:formate dehydrogenase accessory protein FdhD
MDMSDLPLPAAQAHRVLEVKGVRAGIRFEGPDCVATEVAVALEYNGVAHAVMMATPADLEDFGYGFSLTEGIVDRAAQIHDCEWSRGDLGYTLQITVAAPCFARLKERRRTLTGRTGCGLCGAESLAQALRHTTPLQSMPGFTATAVARAMQHLRERQLLLALTGATHAAAWCHADGRIELLREDVGRHNALDKLLGAVVRCGLPASQGFVCITSRASYEMVQKSATLGIGLLAAVSGVTSLAVEVAHNTGVALLGFVRGGDLSIYSHHERFTWGET